MNKEIMEVLNEFEKADNYEKYLIKQIYTEEEINRWDVAEWEKLTGRKSSW